MGNQETVNKLKADGSNLKGAALAAYNNDYAGLSKILQEKPKAANKKDAKGRTPVHWAALRGHLECLQLLYKNGGDLGDADLEDGSTPLHKAATAGHAHIVKWLLDNRVTPKVVDNERQSPLHFAAHEGVVDIGALLIDREAPVDAKDMEGRSPLMWAVFNNNLDFVHLMISAGADLNLQDNGGRTPLIYSAHLGHLEALEMLLENNADLRITDVQLMEPIDHAAYNGHTAVVAFLQSLGQESTKFGGGKSEKLASLQSDNFQLKVRCEEVERQLADAAREIRLLQAKLAGESVDLSVLSAAPMRHAAVPSSDGISDVATVVLRRKVDELTAAVRQAEARALAAESSRRSLQQAVSTAMSHVADLDVGLNVTEFSADKVVNHLFSADPELEAEDLWAHFHSDD